ncbi:hypothetical protein IKF04_03315 [Candidatus Saccharibacteria bacterium]|nr:hypothetical protein [Candidatus Saccharibacteria bacterium]
MILKHLTEQLFWIPITKTIADGTYPFNVLPDSNNTMGQPWLSTYELIYYPKDSDDYELLIKFANRHEEPGCIGIRYGGKLNIFGIYEYMTDGRIIERATIFNATLKKQPGAKVRTIGMPRATSCTYYVADHYPDRNPKLYYVHFRQGELINSIDISHFRNNKEMQYY